MKIQWEELAEHIKKLPPTGKLRATLVYQSGERQNRTFCLSSMDEPMMMAPGKKSWGYSLGKVNHQEISYVLIPDGSGPSKDETWRKSWQKVLARLEASGLWKEIQEDIKLALEIGYQPLQLAYATYWNGKYGEELERVEIVCPKLIDTREDGRRGVNTGVLWYMHTPARVKKMYFGKYGGHLERIALAMEAKQKCHEEAGQEVTGTYDNSFEYNPEYNKAWYSEEYKNCGNGHYYLALDATHALFYEDD